MFQVPKVVCIPDSQWSGATFPCMCTSMIESPGDGTTFLLLWLYQFPHYLGTGFNNSNYLYLLSLLLPWAHKLQVGLLPLVILANLLLAYLWEFTTNVLLHENVLVLCSGVSSSMGLSAILGLVSSHWDDLFVIPVTTGHTNTLSRLSFPCLCGLRGFWIFNAPYSWSNTWAPWSVRSSAGIKKFQQISRLDEIVLPCSVFWMVLNLTN